LKIYQHTNEVNDFMPFISDPIQIPVEHEKDLSDATKNTAVENIAYVQICEPTYDFSKNCFLKSVTVPQDYSTTNYTQENIYLVMYGDTVGGNTDGTWEFMACSKNSQRQQAGGEDMVFEFDEIDLGNYKRCRFFYSRSNEGEIPLPVIGANFSGVKMAFTPRNIDTNCWVLSADNKRTFNSTFPAIISYVSYETSSILHKDNEERHITQEERDRWNNNVTGINVGTDENPINPGARIVGEGFLKGVTAINFRGAFVNVVKKDDTTIDVWINKDNNHPEASTASSEGVTTNSKYVFGSSTNAWQLPYNVNNGEKFTSCHPLTENQKITIKGTKEGITCNPVSVKNLTSKIRVEIYDNNESLIKKHETPDYITRDLPKKGASPSGSSISSSQGGITISITNLKRYCDVDESGLGWDASNGYIPDTVSFNCSITLDTSDILPNGGIYEARVYLDTYDTDGNCESITLHDGEIYYAYDVKTANIDGVPSVKIQTINGEE
jgi:hypothetical protein